MVVDFLKTVKANSVILPKYESILASSGGELRRSGYRLILKPFTEDFKTQSVEVFKDFFKKYILPFKDVSKIVDCDVFVGRQYSYNGTIEQTRYFDKFRLSSFMSEEIGQELAFSGLFDCEGFFNLSENIKDQKLHGWFSYSRVGGETPMELFDVNFFDQYEVFNNLVNLFIYGCDFLHY